MGGFCGNFEPENAVELEAFITPVDLTKARHTQRKAVMFNVQRLIKHRLKGTLETALCPPVGD